MSIEEVQEQIVKLSVSDRLTLVNLIVRSLQNDLNEPLSQTEPIEPTSAYIPDSSVRGKLRADRSLLISQMRGFLKTDKPAPTDAEVQAMLEKRREEKYG